MRSLERSYCRARLSDHRSASHWPIRLQCYWSDATTGDVREGHEKHRVVIINQHLAAYAEAHLAKDEHVYVEGELHAEYWRGEIFEQRSSTEILLWQDCDQLVRFTPGQVPTCMLS